MSRMIYCILVTVTLLTVTTAGEVLAQSEPGHVYTVRYHKVHAGMAAEYNAFYAEFVRPAFDRLKAEGTIVSYLDLQEIYGDRDATHVLIMEYESMGAVEATNDKLDAVSQDLFGKPWVEIIADLPSLREYTGTEMFGSTQSN
jgi:hypothetical protein